MAAGTALAGPLGTVIGALVSNKTVWKILVSIFLFCFLWMFIIANMIGIIFSYLGFANADSYANEAQSTQLTNIRDRVEEVLQQEDYKKEILKIINKNGMYYLEVEFLGETDTSFVKGTTTLELPVDINRLSFTLESRNNPSYITEQYYIETMNLGFGDLVSKDGKIDFEIVGDKRKNMTLSEIEEKLGYKIKLVSEK